MKRFLPGVFALLFFATPAFAIEHYNMSDLSCQQIHDGLLQNHKALLLKPSKKVDGMMLYNSYSAGRQFCNGGRQAPMNQTVKTRDGNCVVTQCVQPSRSWYRP